MRLHLIDGTYELFRAYYGAPAAKSPEGLEVGATRGLLRSLWSFLKGGSLTHGAVAFDHVIESFRNQLFAGYKTGEGMDPDLYAQFSLAERAAYALGLTVWPMVDFEADDAIATGTRLYEKTAGLEKILICSPDKDFAQCVKGKKIVLYDRFQERETDEEGVREKWGIGPESIADWLALVGDTADGIPGVSKWGVKSASSVLAAYGSLENIPGDADAWNVKVRGAATLAANLASSRREAALYKKLATLRFDVPLTESFAELRWRGVRRPELEELCREIDESALPRKIDIWSEAT